MVCLCNQLYLVRTMLESLVDKGDKAAHRHTLRKDMDGQHVTAIEKFLQQSFLWPEMMDLHGTYIHTYIAICRARCVDSTEYLLNQRRWKWYDMIQLLLLLLDPNTNRSA